MRWDIEPKGNHQLNTENIEILAKDIVSRMDINLQYGYFGIKDYFNFLGEKKDTQYVILGKIIKDKRLKTLQLIDDNYQIKQIRDKF